MRIGTPVDVITVTNSSLKDNRIVFSGNNAMPDYFKSSVNIYGCVFRAAGKQTLVANTVPGKVVTLKTSSNVVLSDQFSAAVSPGSGTITVESDLPGLKP